jgi:hypothetical protein
MATTIDARRTVRVRALFAVAVVAFMGALVLQAPRSTAADFSDTNITASFTNVTNLTAGSLVAGSITTTDGFGGYEVKLCKHGLTGWTLTNFGYSTASGNRCVKQFTPGGLNPADGGLDFNAGTAGIQPPTVTNPATGGYWIPTVAGTNNPETKTFQFQVGTGSVEWFNTDSQGPFTLTCDANNACDMVVRISHGGSNTFFVQPLAYAGAVDTTPTTTPPTTTPPTTTPSTTPPTTTPSTTAATTTTTSQGTTTTSSASSTTSTSTSGSTTATTGAGVPVNVSSGSGGSLAFTGSSTRDLLSLALLLLGIGLFVIGEVERRRSRT